MTHPDPYIEEKMKELEALDAINYNLYLGVGTTENCLPYEEAFGQIKTFVLDLLKTQRIKDIEEIEAALPNEFDGWTGNSVYHNLTEREVWANAMLKKIHTILTSRKAAIE